MRTGINYLKVNAFCLALGASLCIQVEAQGQNLSPYKQLPSGSIALQDPLTPQERLDAIRQSLIDASLQSPTRVSTTTWMDAQGSLRENSSFKNGMEVRNINILGFERDENGLARARLQLPNVRDTLKTTSKSNPLNPLISTEKGLQGAVQKFSQLVNKTLGTIQNLTNDESMPQTSSSCRNQIGSRMNHVIGLEVQIDADASNVLLQTLVPQIQDQWVHANAPNGKGNAWRAVNNLPAASMSNRMTAYERALVSNRPESLPWQALLKVKTEAYPTNSLETNLGYQSANSILKLEFQLFGTEGQLAQFEESATLNLEFERSKWSAPKLNANNVVAIQEQLQSWRNVAEEWLSCQAMNPLVTAAKGQQIEISAGSLSGVRTGDEWLIANPVRFPVELMSRDGAPQTLLATVQSVTPFASQLVVSAGPAQSVQANWRAWPTELLVKEPSIVPNTKHTASGQKSTKVKASSNANFTLTPY
jgi:hypothetical protein